MIPVFAAASILAQAPQLPPLPPIRRDPQIIYVDHTGQVIGVRGGRYGPPADLARLPKYVPAAFVSIEDRRFYEHSGFDAVGIARAIVSDISKGRAAQGASTITQQLARNLFLSSDRTLERKADELLYAIQLERTYSKPQILGLYLSRIYFGSGAYGVEAASERYFNKPAERLSLGEAAILASIPKSPTEYDPAEHPQAALERSHLVLDAMVETGAITPAERARALAHPPHIWKSAPTASAQYFIDWIDGEAQKVIGHPREDVVVETTLDLPMEEAAAQSLRTTLAHYAKQRVQQGALVAVDGGGRVRALVGGADYQTSPYDRAVDARRQAGSSWKPFVYLTALEQGMTPQTQVVDEPVTINGWSPHNYESGYLGPITLQTAVAQSINTVAARVADQVGRPQVAATARRLGISTPINTDPAMALGTSLVSPLEMAQAYVAFANGGDRVNAYGIQRIRVGARVLYDHGPAIQTPSIGNPPLGELNQMLHAVVASGTGVHAAVPGYDVAGKTGTTSDFKDAWFDGFTGQFATVVWMGRDDSKPMRGITGGSAPAEAWKSFMRYALKRLPRQPIPPGPPAPPPPLTAPAATPVSTGAAPAQAAPTPVQQTP